jgi:hypothetical protein
MSSHSGISGSTRVQRLTGNGKRSAGRHHGRLSLSAAFFVLSALGCDGLLGDSDHPLTATITVDRAVLQRTDTAQIRVTVTNRSARPVKIPASACPPSFVIVDSTGTVVAPAPRVCLLIAVPPVTLQPAESHVFEDRWFAQDTWTGDPLPSGEYRARVGVMVDRRAARSAPVSITLADVPD